MTLNQTKGVAKYITRVETWQTNLTKTDMRCLLAKLWRRFWGRWTTTSRMWCARLRSPRTYNAHDWSPCQIPWGARATKEEEEGGVFWTRTLVKTKNQRGEGMSLRKLKVYEKAWEVEVVEDTRKKWSRWPRSWRIGGREKAI